MGRSNPYLVEELRSFDLRERGVHDLLVDMAGTAFQGRALGEAYGVLLNMLGEEGNLIFMGLAGSLATAGMWKIVKWFVEERFIDVLVSTGANISEDILEAMGFKYYKGSPNVSDEELLKHKVDRFYDTFADELEYREMEGLIKDFIKSLPKGRAYSTAEFLHLFGKHLDELGIDCIVSAAYRAGVPVFSPAIVDSGYGIAAIMALSEGYHVVLDMVKDFSQIIQVASGPRNLSAIYVGGGVPKDYVNLVTVAQTLLAEARGIKDYYKSLKYVIQITTDAPQWGGLSGATLEEAVSWGKVHPRASKRVVYCDATIALPIIAQALYERGVKRVDPPDITWVFEGVGEA